MRDLTILLLGPPRIELDNEPLTFNRRKSLALLAYLAVEPDPHSRDALAALLWPGYGQTSARSNLRRTLSLLNADLGQGWLDVDRESVALPPRDGLFVDVVEFQERLAACDGHEHSRSQVCAECLPQLQKAVSLYRDDFLSGFTLADSESFDDWQSAITEHLRRKFANALRLLARCYHQRGELPDAIAHTRRWLALDPLHEPAHRTLMRLHAQSGDRSAAVRQYEECVQTLAEELGMEPEPETTALFEEIRAGTLLMDAEPQEEAEPSSKPFHNLPEQPTSFVGRSQELVQIKRHLDDAHCRLLTIVGPGGMGKTRLAIQAASQQLDSFRDGAIFVDLTPVASPDALAATILHAVAPDDYGDINAQRRLCERLSAKQTLLVLDNFEHLLEGADLLPELLHNAPKLKLLVTSRERLNLREEWLEPLDGLDLPDETMTGQSAPQSALPDLDSYGATHLFLDCMRRVRPRWQPSQTDTPTIAGICRTLEGMPLGIELAAAWARALPLDEISAELANSLSILRTSLRDVPARHRSMHAVFDHSWAMLTTHERSILRRMSVFRGGCTREAAETVTGAGLIELTSLMDSSWLRLRASGRYDMHELVRQYCEEKLENEHESETGESVDDVRRRHCDFYTDTYTEPTLQVATSSGSMQMVLPEFANVVGALSFASSLPYLPAIHPSLYIIYRVADLTGLHAIARGPLESASIQLEQFLSTSDIFLVGSQVYYDVVSYLAELHMALSSFAIHQGDRQTARKEINSIEKWSAAVDPSDERYRVYQADPYRRRCFLFDREGNAEKVLHNGRIALATLRNQRHVEIWSRRTKYDSLARDVMTLMGDAFRTLGDYQKAAEVFENEIRLSKESDFGIHFGWIHICIARLQCITGQYTEAEQNASKALSICQEFGNIRQTADAYLQLGKAYRFQGRIDEARQALTKCTHMWYRSNALFLLPSLTELGYVELALKNTSDARTRFNTAKKEIIRNDTEDSKHLVSVFLGLGWTALDEGKHTEAEEFFYRALQSVACAAWEKTEAIAGLAEVAAAEGRYDEAVELLALVVAHPFTAYAQREKSKQSLDALKAPLTDDAFAQRVDAGARRDLQEVIDELLAPTRSDDPTTPGSEPTGLPHA